MSNNVRKLRKASVAGAKAQYKLEVKLQKAEARHKLGFFSRGKAVPRGL